MNERPEVKDAPGLVWAPRKADEGSWVAEWHARTDLIKRGFLPQRARLWAGKWPSDVDCKLISDQCSRLQAEMLVWGRGGIPVVGTGFDGTLGSLIRLYQTDPQSSYQETRYASRINSDSRCKLIAKDYGDVLISDIDARMLKDWHTQWLSGGRVTSAHGKMGQLRTLFKFGATLVGKRGNAECRRLKEDMSDLRFKMGKPRTERLTVEYAQAVIATAHAEGYHSIAMAQALQFELTLRQRDVIGEWVPMSEQGMSIVISGQMKWGRGLVWEELDGWILKHMTSKRSKPIEVDLRFAPMVMAELARLPDGPRKGPMVVCEATALPYAAKNFRHTWRWIATKAGVPKNVFNMDSRAGAISEAITAGARLEDVRHAATHSDIGMTQKYDRSAAEATGKVMQMRAGSRNKTGTDKP